MHSRRVARPPINVCKASRPQSGLANEGLDKRETEQSQNSTISDNSRSKWQTAEALASCTCLTQTRLGADCTHSVSAWCLGSRKAELQRLDWTERRPVSQHRSNVLSSTTCAVPAVGLLCCREEDKSETVLSIRWLRPLRSIQASFE